MQQKKFQKLQNDMNKADAENSKIYLKKREIVRMDETEPVKNETNLMDVLRISIYTRIGRLLMVK